MRDYISIQRERANIGEGSIYIEITAQGRTDGDFKIEYAVSQHGYEQCKGNDFNTVVDEHLRRDVWEEVNQPKLLAGHGRG